MCISLCISGPECSSADFCEQRSSPRTAHGLMDCSFWDKAKLGSGYYSFTCFTKGTKSTGGQSCVLSHEILDKEHIPWVCSNVSLLFTNIFQHRCLKLEHLKSKPVFFSAAACNVAIKILSPKLDKLSFLYSKAIFLDGYECKKVPLIYQWCFMPGDGFVWKRTD